MTKQEEIREGIANILGVDLINLNNTHENAPPGHDCGEECGVDLEDQIAASNPIMKPMRSGGTKHKKCVDCWEGYIRGLITKIQEYEHSQGVVIKVTQKYPLKPAFIYEPLIEGKEK